MNFQFFFLIPTNEKWISINRIMDAQIRIIDNFKSISESSKICCRFSYHKLKYGYS